MGSLCVDSDKSECNAHNAINGLAVFTYSIFYPERLNLTRSSNLLFLIFIGTFVSLIGPIVNGGVFFYFDTSSYIEQMTKIMNFLVSKFAETTPPDPANGAVAAVDAAFGAPEDDRSASGGRSVYFSIFAYLGWVTDLWIVAIIHGALLSWLVILPFEKIAMHRWRIKALATIGVISIFSSASLFAGLIMPDIWAGFMVLSFATLYAFRGQLSVLERWSLFGILCASALFHTSHVLLIAALVALVCAAQLFRFGRSRLPVKTLALPMIALVLGLFGNFAYQQAVKIGYGAEIVSFPFLTAHLVDMGPGTRQAQKLCPDAGYAVCNYVDSLPVSWIDFLFSKDTRTGVFSIASEEEKRRLSSEQLAFAFETLKAEPVATVSGFLTDGISQLWTLSVRDVAIGHENFGFIESNFPLDLTLDVQQTRLFAAQERLDSLLMVMQLSSVVSVLLLVWWAGWRDTGAAAGSVEDRLLVFVILVLAGLVLNALICGVFASPYGRFQARIVWLLPVVACLTILRAFNDSFDSFVKRAARHDEQLSQR